MLYTLIMKTNNHLSPAPNPPSALKKWIIAIRPWSFPASTMPVLFGTSLAVIYGQIQLNLAYFLLALLAMVILHSAANMLSDFFDFKQGLDREVTPVSGAIVRGWITPPQALKAATILFVSGSLLGLLLSWLTSPLLLYVGGLGIVIGLVYTLMKYHALGDLAVFLNFGILGSLGAWIVQTETFSWLPLLWAVPIAMLVAGILHANNWRDVASDTTCRIKTVASLLGDRGSLIYYGTLLFGSMTYVIAFIFIPRLLSEGKSYLTMPFSFLVCLMALPAAFKLWQRALHRHQPRHPLDFVILDGATSQYNLLFGTLCLLSIWLDFFI